MEYFTCELTLIPIEMEIVLLINKTFKFCDDSFALHFFQNILIASEFT